MSSLREKLFRIQNITQSAIDDLLADENIAGNDAVRELIARCRDIDEHYKEYCAECDVNWGEEPGTSYKEGVNMEFYIESSDWHDISLELRKLEGKV
jgi:hypothetical protein